MGMFQQQHLRKEPSSPKDKDGPKCSCKTKIDSRLVVAHDSCGLYLSGWFTTDCGSRHFLQRVVNCERRRLLPWWEIPECLSELSRKRGSSECHVPLLEDPVPITVRGDISELIRIGA